MECWVISDSNGNVFDVYKTKEAAMCQLINKIAEDEMPDSEKWAAFKVCMTIQSSLMKR